MATISFTANDAITSFDSEAMAQGLLAFLAEGFVIESGSETLIFGTDELNYGEIYGENLSYAFKGEVLTGLKGGTVAGLNFVNDGDFVVSMFDLNLTAKAINKALKDPTHLEALLFSGNDLFESSASSDTISLWNGNDTAFGGLGDDWIWGGAGNDSILGGSGSDTVYGGDGIDTLTGGDDADHFAFYGNIKKLGTDTITDFDTSEDDIWLHGFKGMATEGTLAETQFVDGTKALDGDDRVIFNSATGQLWFDADGNGKGKQVLLAVITTTEGLTADHIILL